MTAQTRSRASRRLGWLVVVGLALAALAAPSGTSLAADKTEITICHATGSQGHPYEVNSPAINSSGAFAGELAGGHNGHTGPLWFSGIDVKWGDIIPPYDYPPADFTYAGLNWTTAGQAIYNNGCNIPQATATPTQAPTATPTPAPTPTEAPTATPAPTGSVEPTQTVNPTDPPTGTVEAATATPARTLPSTSTIDGSGNGPMNDGWRVVLLALAGILAAALLLTPATAVVRKDDRRR
jgi:hypothetical protein